jgi:hypothetical protein
VGGRQLEGRILEAERPRDDARKKLALARVQSTHHRLHEQRITEIGIERLLPGRAQKLIAADEAPQLIGRRRRGRVRHPARQSRGVLGEIGEQYRLAVEIRHVEARQRIARERIADVHRALLVGEHQHRRGERLCDRSDLEQSVGLGRAVVFGVTVEALRARLAFAWRRSQGRRMAATLARPPDR